MENRIEEAFTLKLDNAITHDFWKSQNDKWQTEKDKLKIQLDEIDKLDKEFYEKADILLGFTDNAYEYFSKGNIKQKRKILEIISDEITYKDKNFNVKLKPLFQTIIENQYNLVQKNANNRCPYSCDMTISNQTMTNICPLYLKQFLLLVFLLFRCPLR